MNFISWCVKILARPSLSSPAPQVWNNKVLSNNILQLSSLRWNLFLLVRSHYLLVIRGYSLKKNNKSNSIKYALQCLVYKRRLICSVVQYSIKNSYPKLIRQIIINNELVWEKQIILRVPPWSPVFESVGLHSRAPQAKDVL